MEDLEKKLELMQEQIDILGDIVQSQAKTIKDLIEIAKDLKDFVIHDKKLPEKVIYYDPRTPVQ